jgi:hypothetical protein
MDDFDLTKGISFTRMSDSTERTAMQSEHRRTARYAFGGAAEVTDIQSGNCVVSVTSQLGLFGCFVKTMSPFPKATAVSLKITNNGRTFAAQGKVAYTLPTGMGIAFDAISPNDQAVLEDWLIQETG